VQVNQEDENVDQEMLNMKCCSYLKELCYKIPERSVGSAGNREATHFCADEISALGWESELPEFDAMDWKDGGAILRLEGEHFEAFVSPYSLGCTVEAQLCLASTIAELEQGDITGEILLLHGEIAKEQLMPKNFVFYNPEEHQKIIALLEAKQPGAIITATGRNAALAGGVYPFPMIEDGDFDIPSVYMTEEEGRRLAAYQGKPVVLKSFSERIPAKACNVIARKGNNPSERIVITAHIDAKKGSPGAIDNATGVTVLLLLANLLKDYDGDRVIELVALNGEDYYAASGQMNYISQNQERFADILLNINIDGAGYKEGKTALSLFGLPDKMQKRAIEAVEKFEGFTVGVQWPQGDHSIFIQYGCPAIAVTSQWFLENMDSQDITHTPKDNLEIVDSGKVVEIAEAIQWFITGDLLPTYSKSIYPPG